METADYYYLQQNHQQQHQLSCGLTRYRSVPASLLENHVNGTTGVDAYGDFRSSSSSRPEMETFFMMSGNGSSDSGVSGCHDMQEYEEKSVKQEELMYQNQSLPLQTCSFGVVGTDVGLENSNLVRQSSSPAQFFSNQGLDNGFNGIRKMNTLRACNGINGEPTSTSRLYNNHISFSSGPSSYSKPMPQIARIETGADNGSLGNSNGSNGHFIPNLMSDSRHNPSLSSLKRARESNGDLFCGLSRLQTQNQDRRDSLTHQLSLPKTYEEDVVEKFWQFQGSTPCKIRAKRGFATHPRSIAERVRRTRISERMRKLQGLFPNIDKQTNTADMLDMAVEYIKDLQKQVKTLRDTKANCSC